MRKIDMIIVHCSATKKGMDIGISEIDAWHKERGFNGVGYHYVIRRDGVIEFGRKHGDIGAHCKGKNANSLGICLVGGINNMGEAENNFSDVQFESLGSLLNELVHEYKISQIHGHKDFANKACPCFDVQEFCIEQGIL